MVEKMNSCEYIIVQAGGEGTRMRELTRNKPKALVSVDNLPMIFHLFKKYPDKKFVVIGDYKKDVLDRYLETFAEVKFISVDAGGKRGTCSGIRNALKAIPDDSKFMLIWSDLILGSEFDIRFKSENQIGLSNTFPCRWEYRDGVFSEIASNENGVAGVFTFENKNTISDVPDSGEFVRWLQSKKITFEPVFLDDSMEFGTIEKIGRNKCRPFNRMIIENDKIIKEGINSQGEKLALREKAWYRYVEKLGGISIPKIYSFDPLTMEQIDGKNVFEYDLSYASKKKILKKIMDGLTNLHNRVDHPADLFSMKEAYFTKTMDRLNKIRNLIPQNNREHITINGKKCKNVFFIQKELREKIEKISCNKFQLIHGDCTFSNIMLKSGSDPIFIDPRGYFGYTELFGDQQYDWAKLYYSLVGNYDQFNLGKFNLTIDEEIELTVESNKWEEMETEFEKNLPKDVKINEIRLIHAIIWLSLTTYAWNDYDSVCGAFYRGLYFLEDLI